MLPQSHNCISSFQKLSTEPRRVPTPSEELRRRTNAEPLGMRGTLTGYSVQSSGTCTSPGYPLLNRTENSHNLKVAKKTQTKPREGRSCWNPGAQQRPTAPRHHIGALHCEIQAQAVRCHQSQQGVPHLFSNGSDGIKCFAGKNSQPDVGQPYDTWSVSTSAWNSYNLWASGFTSCGAVI